MEGGGFGSGFGSGFGASLGAMALTGEILCMIYVIVVVFRGFEVDCSDFNCLVGSVISRWEEMGS